MAAGVRDALLVAEGAVDGQALFVQGARRRVLALEEMNGAEVAQRVDNGLLVAERAPDDQALADQGVGGRVVSLEAGQEAGRVEGLGPCRQRIPGMERQEVGDAFTALGQVAA